MWRIVLWEFLKHVLGYSTYYGLPTFPFFPTAPLFGLDSKYLIQNTFSSVDLVSNVSVGMKAEHLWYVLQRHGGDELIILLHGLAFRNSIALVKTEISCKEIIVEPNRSECV